MDTVCLLSAARAPRRPRPTPPAPHAARAPRRPRPTPPAPEKLIVRQPFRITFSALFSSLSLLLWLGTSQAPTLAGSYLQVSQTGGTVTDDDGSAAYADGGPFAYGYVAYGYGATGYSTNGWGILPENPAKCSDEITTTFQWQPSFPGEPPPKQVVVHESVDVGYGDANIPPDESAQGQCNDGFGDPEVDYLPNGPGPFICRRQTGDHYTVKPGGPQVTVRCSPSASASVDDDADCWTCWVAYNVDISIPHLTLSRDGARGETIVDADGTVHGDTIYSYTDTEFEDTANFPNWQYFHPIFSGVWSQKYYINGSSEPDVSWNWSPDESDDTMTTGQWKMPYGSMNIADGKWVGHPTGPSPDSPMVYTATDNQYGDSVTAKYILTVHDTNERQADAVDDSNHLYREVDGSNWANPSNENYTVSFHVDQSHATSAIFTYGGSVGVDWLEAWGMNVTGTASYSTQVQDTTTSGGGESFILPPHSHVYPITKVFSHHEEFWVKSYDAGGYTGQSYETTDSFSGPQNITYTTSQIFYDSNGG